MLGHEIAHQLARHSAEKLSFTKIALFLGVIVSLVFDPSWSMQRIVMELGMMVCAVTSGCYFFAIVGPNFPGTNVSLNVI